jgi:hypothetical protein
MISPVGYLLAILIVGLIGLFGYTAVKENKSKPKEYFIKDIAIRAWHDEELVHMIKSGYIYKTEVQLSSKDKYEIAKELRLRGIRVV